LRSACKLPLSHCSSDCTKIVHAFALPGDPDTTKYKGITINVDWDPQTTCQTARSLIKNSFPKEHSDELYHQACTVSKVTAPLPGKYVIYDPYAVSWPNGIAARVLITSEGLKVIGVSSDGIPNSWYE
jgi:hypothetical protein